MISVTMLHKLVEILLDMDGRDLVDGHGSNRKAFQSLCGSLKTVVGRSLHTVGLESLHPFDDIWNFERSNKPDLEPASKEVGSILFLRHNSSIHFVKPIAV